MELLKRLVRARLPESLDEELRVENVLPIRRRHYSESGEVMYTPRIARVPSTSCRRNTTNSSARSIVSVAVDAPSARFAARKVDNVRR